MKNEVAVIGGGTAGLMAASMLAENGIGVTVFEAKKSVEENADRASGVLSVSGLNEAGIPYKNAIANRLNGAYFFHGSKCITVSSKKTKAYVLDRKKLAKACFDLAVKSGAEVRLGNRINKGELKKMGNEYFALIGADGAVSSVADAFGFPGIEKYVLTYKAEYVVAKIKDPKKVGIYLDRNAKGFFGWHIPYSENKLEVGIGIESGKGNSKMAFDSFIKNRRIEKVIKGGERIGWHASIIPLEARKKTAKGNVVLIGDAAGQVKASTGGGIIYGALCAAVAAKAIIASKEKGSGIEAYENMWRNAYGLDLALNSLIHRYYSNEFATSLLFKISSLFRIEKLLEKYGDMDQPAKTLANILKRKEC